MYRDRSTADRQLFPETVAAALFVFRKKIFRNAEDNPALGIQKIYRWITEYRKMSTGAIRPRWRPGTAFGALTAALLMALPVSAADSRVHERVPLVMPGVTVRSTLPRAKAIINRTIDRDLTLISIRWSALKNDEIRYQFHVPDNDTLTLSRGVKDVPGTMFAEITVNLAGTTLGIQPWKFIGLQSNDPNGGYLVYNKDLLPLEGPVMNLDDVVQTLQDSLTVDLGLDDRRRLCRSGPVDFKLMPNLTLYKWPKSPFGYSAQLKLYADHGSRGRASTLECKYGALISLGMDPFTGEYVVTEYHDGLAQIQYSSIWSDQTTEAEKRDGVAILRKSFQIFDSLFSPTSAVELDESTDADRKQREGNRWALKSEAVNRAMAASRRKSVQEAVKLEPRLAMGHAALGVLLSTDCGLEKPSSPGNCEKGIRALLKARELAPELALPAYALVRRMSYPHFPKSLRPLLKESAAALCDKVRDSAPAWDWAYYSTCGFRGDEWGKQQRDERNLRRIKGIVVIRPADILRGYLELELKKQPK